MVRSEPFFFKTGVIIAVLREDRTEPEIREECAILTINEPREGRESSTRLVGQVYTMMTLITNNRRQLNYCREFKTGREEDSWVGEKTAGRTIDHIMSWPSSEEYQGTEWEKETVRVFYICIQKYPDILPKSCGLRIYTRDNTSSSHVSAYMTWEIVFIHLQIQRWFVHLFILQTLFHFY